MSFFQPRKVVNIGRAQPKDLIVNHSRVDQPNATVLHVPGREMADNGYSIKKHKIIAIPLDAAFEDQEYLVVGNVLQVIWITDATKIIWIRYNDSNNDQLPCSRYFFMAGSPFTRILVSVKAADGVLAGGVAYIHYTQDDNSHHLRIS